jgi:penicillin-binding protein 1A
VQGQPRERDGDHELAGDLAPLVEAEALLARHLEVVVEEPDRQTAKEKIITLYLNRVFFGSGFYGAEAASRGYFGKHAKDLNLSEAATLTGLLKSPNNLSPWRVRPA